VESLQQWVHGHVAPKPKQLPPELAKPLTTLQQVLEQDLEPDPSGGRKRKLRVRQGVAADRRISMEGPELRHGRKSKSKCFNGYTAKTQSCRTRFFMLGGVVRRRLRDRSQASPAGEKPGPADFRCST
jgi:hypothetical protein